MGSFEMPRRSFLAISVAVCSGGLFSGCGGGGTAPGPSVSVGDFKRTTPSGKVVDQVNQYSGMLDASSGMSAEIMPVLADVEFFTGGSRSSVKSIAYHLASGIMASTAIGINYRKLIGTTLQLDDAANMGMLVSQQNGLSGTSSLENPQWHAEIMRKIHGLLLLNEASQRFAKTVGIQELSALVLEQQNPASRAILYALFAVSFNRWVDRTEWMVSRSPRAELKLKVGSDMSVDAIGSELARVPSIVTMLNLSPGFTNVTRSGRVNDNPAEDELDGLKAGLSTFAQSVVDNFKPFTVFISETDAFIRNEVRDFGLSYNSFVVRNREFALSVLTSERFIETTEYLFDKASFLKDLKKNLGQAIFEEAAKEAVGFLFSTEYGEAGERFVDCLSTLASLFPSLATASSSVVAAGACVIASAGGCVIPIAGAAVLGAIAYLDVLAVNDDCLKNAGLSEEERDAIGTAIDDLQSNTQQPLRDMPAFTNPAAAECDQLAAAGVSLKTLPLTGGGRSRQVALEQVPLTGLPVEVYRHLLAGRGIAGQYPRTYDNVRRAHIALLFEYASRKVETLAPTLSSTKLTFYSSDFAVLLRRDGGTTLTRIQSLVNARIMCTSPGFAPQRSDNANIRTLPSLPKLELLDGLGFGVNVDVK